MPGETGNNPRSSILYFLLPEFILIIEIILLTVLLAVYFIAKEKMHPVYSLAYASLFAVPFKPALVECALVPACCLLTKKVLRSVLIYASVLLITRLLFYIFLRPAWIDYFIEYMSHGVALDACVTLIPYTIWCHRNFKTGLFEDMTGLC